MFRLQPRPTLFPYTMLFRSFAFSESPANNCIPRPSNAAVGAAGPEKVPAVASIVGAAALGLRVLPLASTNVNVTGPAAVTALVPALRGVTRFVTRGDSSDVGPELAEFRSNAVTA